MPRAKAIVRNSVAKSRAADRTQQALKSAQTRARLIAATIRCLVKFGFARTTTPRVADEAKLSRGAMLHHFKNGAALIHATVVELHEKRLRALRRTAVLDHSNVRATVRTYWEQLSSPTFIAFHELAMAARSDKALARVLLPLQHEYQDRWYSEAVALYPEWQSDRSSFDLALIMSKTLLEGMALGQLTSVPNDDMIERILTFVEREILALKPPAALPS